MPTNTLDTFFACTILVAAALIATAFLTSTMQARIDNTQQVNENSYLKAIADHIITSPGIPSDWGSGSMLPQDFGLAQSQATAPYILDLDKVTRLNSQNNNSLTYLQILNAAKLTNLALGIKVSPLLSVGIQQTENRTVGDDVSFTFTVLTSVGGKLADARLRYFIVANGIFAGKVGNSTGGMADFELELPNSSVDDALLVVFARASYDDRVTSFGVYSFAGGAQQSAPRNSIIALSAKNYTLTYSAVSPQATVQNGYVLSYSYESSLTSPSSEGCPIPRVLDASPFVIVLCGEDGSDAFTEWMAYPQVPLAAGAGLAGSQRTVFTYIVTIKGSLYRAELSFGGVGA